MHSQNKMAEEIALQLRRVKNANFIEKCPVCNTHNTRFNGGYHRKYCKYCKVNLEIAKEKLKNGK